MLYDNNFRRSPAIGSLLFCSPERSMSFISITQCSLSHFVFFSFLLVLLPLRLFSLDSIVCCPHRHRHWQTDRQSDRQIDGKQGQKQFRVQSSRERKREHVSAPTNKTTDENKWSFHCLSTDDCNFQHCLAGTVPRTASSVQWPTVDCTVCVQHPHCTLYLCPVLWVDTNTQQNSVHRLKWFQSWDLPRTLRHRCKWPEHNTTKNFLFLWRRKGHQGTNRPTKRIKVFN